MKGLINAFLDYKGEIQLLSLMLMLRITFGLKCSKTRSFLTMIWYAVVFKVLNTGFIWLRDTQGILSSNGNLLCFFALMMACACGYAFTCLHCLRSQIISTSLYIINLICIALMLGMHAQTLTASGSEVILYLVYLIIVAGGAVLLKTKTRRITNNVSVFYRILINLVPILILVLLFSWDSGSTTLEKVTNSTMILVLDMMIYLLYMHVEEDQAKQMEMALNNQMMEMDLRQLESMEQMYESTRTLRHELKNYCFLLTSMIEEKRSGEALACLRQMTDAMQPPESYSMTGNKLVDMIVSQKCAEAAQQKVDVQTEIRIPAEIAVDDQHLCSLLANIWGNALEASRGVEVPAIRFTMQSEKGYLMIELANRINGSVLERNPMLQTSKPDAKVHGVGIRLIRRIVSEYSGAVKFHEKDGWFLVSIMMNTGEKHPAMSASRQKGKSSPQSSPDGQNI